MIVWLLYKADSATSTVCMIIAGGIFIVARQPAVAIKPYRLLAISISIVGVYGFLESVFDVKDTIIVMLGREPNLTSRAPMWEDLLSMVRNPVIGAGYESFWLGPRLEYMLENWKIGSQAHNGYIEMYLNMGIIGLLFIGTWFLSGLKKIAWFLKVKYPIGVLRFCLLVVVALYNWTEATFFGNNIMWMLFFFAIMDPPGKSKDI